MVYSMSGTVNMVRADEGWELEIEYERFMVVIRT